MGFCCRTQFWQCLIKKMRKRESLRKFKTRSLETRKTGWQKKKKKKRRALAVLRDGESLFWAWHMERLLSILLAHQKKEKMKGFLVSTTKQIAYPRLISHLTQSNPLNIFFSLSLLWTYWLIWVCLSFPLFPYIVVDPRFI